MLCVAQCIFLTSIKKQPCIGVILAGKDTVNFKVISNVSQPNDKEIRKNEARIAFA